MRILLCAILAAIGLTADPAFAQTDRTAAAFWKTVQARCDQTAAKPASALAGRIAQSAIDESKHFGGHRIDADGRLIRFGLTEAEHNAEGDTENDAQLGQLGWRQVMKYWRTLYGDDAYKILEVRGYTGASNLTDDAQRAPLVREDLGPLLRSVEGVSDPAHHEIVREALIRAAIIDTPWSAAFVSYVLRQSGVPANAFDFAFAHHVYIYDAFATSAAESNGETNDRLYRACPLGATRARAGDLICFQREPQLADANEESVRERIRAELGAPANQRSIRRAHCEVVAYIDAPARKMYTVGGNVSHAVTVRKLKLGRGLKFATARQRNCGHPGDWTLPDGSSAAPGSGGQTRRERCSLNDRNWFVLLQMR